MLRLKKVGGGKRRGSKERKRKRSEVKVEVRVEKRG